MKTLKYSLCFLACIASSVCWAKPRIFDDSGFYLGANFGQSSFDEEPDLHSIFDIQTSQGQSKTDSAWSVIAGYRVIRYAGLEVGYLDLGTTSLFATGRDFGFSTSARLDGRVAVNGGTVAVVGALPVNNFEFNAKVGVFAANTRINAKVTVGTTPVTTTDSAVTSSTLVGLGLGYTFGRHFHIRADATRYLDVGDEKKTGQRDITSVTAGFAFRF